MVLSCSVLCCQSGRKTYVIASDWVSQQVVLIFTSPVPSIDPSVFICAVPQIKSTDKDLPLPSQDSVYHNRAIQHPHYHQFVCQSPGSILLHLRSRSQILNKKIELFHLKQQCIFNPEWECHPFRLGTMANSEVGL